MCRFFHLKGQDYLTIVDRFSSWPCSYHFKAGTINNMTLINISRDLFTSYEALEEFSSDGMPQFKAQLFQQFLKDLGIVHCLSSGGYPQSCGCADVGVKTSKGIIFDNTN